jgi:NAD(P)-dependent dehydrogenase (short-subunit alcohol dehydrogenase family)
MSNIGMRLCHNAATGKIDWVHLLEMQVGDVDLTDLDDADFEAYVRANFKGTFLTAVEAEK